MTTRFTDTKSTSGRAFVRSLNILLKFARLYGFEHARTTGQLEIAWQELRAAIPTGTDNGLMLGATGSQLLLDGVPLEGAPAEKQFAQLLSAAGLASIQFFPSVTEEEIGRFARAFPTGKAKPTELAKQVKAALEGAHGIRLNEICFVATDSRLKDASMAAQLAAASLGEDQNEFKKWLNDRGSGPVGVGTGTGGSGTGGSGSGGEGGVGTGGGGTVGTSTGAGGSGSGSGNVAGSDGGGIGGGGGMGGSSGAASEFSVPRSSTGGTLTGPYAAGSGVAGVAGVTGGGLGAGLGVGLGPGSGGPGGGSGSGPWRGTGQGSGPSEDEIYGILSALTSFGNVGAGQGGAEAAVQFQEQMSQLPGTAQDTLKRAIAGLAAQAPEGQPDESVLVKLAEHLAIRFAL